MSCEEGCGRMQNDGSADAYGCLYCRVGSEKQIARLIEREDMSLRVLFAEKKRRRRQGKRFFEEETPLFPGYLFFRAPADYEAQRLMRKPDVYRLLQTADADWRLQGADARFARELFRMRGVIGLSKARMEGDRIRIVEGALKEYQGQILRVNRRAQTAQVCVHMCGREVLVWLGFELLEDDAR